MTTTHHQHEFIYQYTSFLALGDIKGAKILDIPSGEGKYTVRAFKAGASRVLSVDLGQKMIDLTKDRVAAAGFSESWSGVVADATKKLDLPEAGFDSVMANYLFEYASSQADLATMAENLFRAARPGARLSVLYVPGHTPAEDIAPIIDVSGIECPVLTPETKPGTMAELKYHNSGGFTYEIFYWPVEMVKETLQTAGFVDVAVHKLKLDPSYTGAQDLEKFARHTGNRSLTAMKPAKP